MIGLLGRNLNLGSPVSTHPLNRGLGAFWLGLPNNSGGTRLFDLTGRGNHGTLTGGPTWASGYGGFPAVAFDGTNDVAASDPLPFGATPTTDYAIACSVYPRSTTGEQVYWGYGFDIGFGGGFALECESGNFKVALPSVARLDSGVAVVAGKWYRLLTTRRGGTHYLYIGDQAGGFTKYTLGSNNLASTSDATWTRMLMGAHSHTGTRAANAVINGGFYWQRVLSDDEAWVDYDQWRRGWPDLLARVPRRVAAVAAAGGGGFQSAWAAGSNVVLTPAVF